MKYIQFSTFTQTLEKTCDIIFKYTALIGFLFILIFIFLGTNKFNKIDNIFFKICILSLFSVSILYFLIKYIIEAKHKETPQININDHYNLYDI